MWERKVVGENRGVGREESKTQSCGRGDGEGKRKGVGGERWKGRRGVGREVVLGPQE